MNFPFSLGLDTCLGKQLLNLQVMQPDNSVTQYPLLFVHLEEFVNELVNRRYQQLLVVQLQNVSILAKPIEHMVA